MVLFSVKEVLWVRYPQTSCKVKESRKNWNGLDLLSFLGHKDGKSERSYEIIGREIEEGVVEESDNWESLRPSLG